MLGRNNKCLKVGLPKSRTIQHKTAGIYCTVCKKEMTAVITTIWKHQATAHHQQQVKRLQVPSSGRI